MNNPKPAVSKNSAPVGENKKNGSKKDSLAKEIRTNLRCENELEKKHNKVFKFLLRSKTEVKKKNKSFVVHVIIIIIIFSHFFLLKYI